MIPVNWINNPTALLSGGQHGNQASNQSFTIKPQIEISRPQAQTQIDQCFQSSPMGLFHSEVLGRIMPTTYYSYDNLEATAWAGNGEQEFGRKISGKSGSGHRQSKGALLDKVSGKTFENLCQKRS